MHCQSSPRRRFSALQGLVSSPAAVCGCLTATAIANQCEPLASSAHKANKMQPVDGAALEEASQEMARCLEVCTRLGAWTQRDTDSPVVSQAQQQVAKLIARIQCIGEQFRHESNSHGPYSINQLSDSLQSAKGLLFETISLLNFASDVEQHGDDGALNALYSSTFLLANTRVDVGQVHYLNSRMHQSSKEFFKVLSKWFGPQATSSNSRWGIGMEPPPDVLQNLR